jgi:hypothetical protein
MRSLVIALILLLACEAARRQPQTIRLEYGGLGIWRGVTGGYVWSVVVDVKAHTITATDPDGKPRTRPLEANELGELVTLADAARAEPRSAQTTATDYHEQLDVIAGDDHFEVENSGPIERPAAKQLVGALDAAAHWPRVD